MADETNRDDDISYDSKEDLDDSIIAEESTLQQIKKLREKLKIVESEKQEYLDGWQRSQAEFVNLRKKDEIAKEQAIKFAKAGLILELIPVLDSFDMALAHKKAWDELPKDWRVGMESIYNQLNSILSVNSVKKITALGEKFDPKKHEAVAMVSVDHEKDDHVVVEVLQAGYEFNGEVLRPAKVKVGEYKK